MKPPARSAPGACGASGSATAMSTAHATTTSRARRTTKRPSRSKGVTAAHRMRELPSASIAGEMQLFLVAFQQPIPFGISIAVVTLMIVHHAARPRCRARVAPAGSGGSPTRTRSSCSRCCSSCWAVVFGIGLQLVPHVGASTPVRRSRADRPVQRLLHHDGAALGRDRGVAPPVSRAETALLRPRRVPRGCPRLPRRTARRAAAAADLRRDERGLDDGARVLPVDAAGRLRAGRT